MSGFCKTKMSFLGTQRWEENSWGEKSRRVSGFFSPFSDAKKTYQRIAGACLSTMRKIISVVLGMCVKVKGTQGWSLSVVRRLLSTGEVSSEQRLRPHRAQPSTWSLLCFCFILTSYNLRSGLSLEVGGQTEKSCPLPS